MKIFKTFSSYKIEDNLCFTVRNPEVCYDFDNLKGSKVIIDGDEYLIKNVDRMTHLPPFRVGEIIGLMVSQ